MVSFSFSSASFPRVREKVERRECFGCILLLSASTSFSPPSSHPRELCTGLITARVTSGSAQLVLQWV